MESIAPSTPTPTAAGNKSPRGNLIKKLGDPAGITNKDGKPMVNFTVNSITPDAPCTGPYPQAPQNGHFVVLDVAVETTPDFVSSQGPLTFDMGPGMMKFVGKNGTTYNGNLGTGPAYTCLPDTQMLSANGRGIGPAEKVTGKVVLDVPDTTGTLIYTNYLISNIGGWEYNF
ncbi:DUF4352 domain-containing protein [Arthrobacter sp. DNA4]|uniref:DUF4352 domain-containing protein n=1 Tax=Arthrobacter sp. DNA4 TaxID=2963432 RepID=UPI0020CC40A8|nr:DUF4352 domain-containing protein [Arthrobacter sp. DNA4]UTT70566.1 DUF4352 domain-containing protein [Arthrobacter sp. DNA4]